MFELGPSIAVQRAANNTARSGPVVAVRPGLPQTGSVRYSNNVSVEQLDPTERTYSPGRTAAWLAKQVELGLTTVDLSISQYRILSILAEGSAQSSALAERLAVRPPSVTAVIDGLVTRGLVERTHREDDRRRVSLELTTEGLSVLASADEAVNGRLEQISSGLGAKGSARALSCLSHWHDAMVLYRAARAKK